ncbi:M42 family metallopeptidase [Streptococcus halichoeri]|uniref:M42 family metallopeptidase n=1 Tax=Streptococcus halichoeri TaxID=254785 RepID=UPI00135B8880|nr:M42 family metallopeptidase [Streptococcus halichoeri]
MQTTVSYITSLANIPSPTGFTAKIMQYVVSELRSFGYEPILTAKGGLMVTVQGQDDQHQRVVTAHLDTLGAMVRAIKPDGRLKLDLVGGFVYNAIEGENCTVHVAKTGQEISGTILMHQTSVHVYKDAGTAERNQANMEVRLDEKVTTAEETAALGIEVGDFISFDPRVVVTETGFIKSRHLDDKVSAAILMKLLQDYKTKQITLPYTTHFYFSAFEEVGHGANSSLPPQTLEYLAVDMGAMGDDQATDEYTVSICVKDASGPYHYDLRQHLVALAQAQAIPYKLDIYPYYGSDASAAMRAGAEVRHALLGAGIESSHSYERTHTDSVQATERLVDAYLQSPMLGIKP